MRGLVLAVGVGVGALTLGWSPVAEAGCKVQVTTDDFSGASQKVAAVKLAGYQKPLYSPFQIVETGDKRTLQMPLLARGGVEAPLPKEKPVQLKLEDGTLLELLPVEPVLPEVQAVGSVLLTRWAPQFVLDDAGLAALAASKVKAVKLPLVGQDKVLDTKDFFVKDVLKKAYGLAGCMQKAQ